MPLFIDSKTAQAVLDALEQLRVRIRRAQRATTYLVSRAGQEANVALHEAEKIAEQAKKLVGG